MAVAEVSSLWQTAFPGKVRPTLYSSQSYNEEGFYPITNSQEFMTDTTILDGQQLHALSLNNQIALKAAQDEYLALEQELNHIKHKDPSNRPAIKDPRILPDQIEFEERKESILYGYKYDPKRPLPTTANGLPVANPKDVSEVEKHDTKQAQDPWTQGGFVPGKRQVDTLRAKAADPRNPDGWTPLLKNGRQLIPKMYNDSDPDFHERYGRYNTEASKAQHVQPAILANTRRAVADEAFPTSRRGTPAPINKPLRSTRFNGAKIPQTRDVSEAPSIALSRASTPKRKRGDTPVPSIEYNSPTAKKTKLMNVLQEEPPKRKRHNQYTKARERAEQAAAAAAASASASIIVPPTSVLLAEEIPAAQARATNKRVKPERPNKDANGVPLWKAMTANEKFSHTQWGKEDLLDAIAADPSWISGPYDYNDPALPIKIKTKLMKIPSDLAKAANPTRSWAAHRTWLQWHYDGKDKRGPRRNKSESESDHGSSAEPETPLPTTEIVGGNDLDVEDVIITPGAHKLANDDRIVEYEDTKDELHDSKRPRRRARR